MNKHLFYLLLFFCNFGIAQTGCIESINGQYPYGQFDVTCNNQFQNISMYVKAGTYSTLQLYADRVYSFKSSMF